MEYSGIFNVRWQFTESSLWQKVLIIILDVSNIQDLLNDYYVIFIQSYKIHTVVNPIFG